MTLRRLFSSIFGWRVIAGPFRGLRYVSEGVGSVLPAKLLGSYERELWPQIEQILAYTPWCHRAVRAMDEQRPGPMRWFWFEPLHR